MRADKLYEAALGLLGEEEYSCNDFTHLRFRIINQALSMCLSTHNTSLVSKGSEPLDKFNTITNNADEIPTEDNFTLEVVCPIVGALLISNHDRDHANLLFDMAENAKKKYSKVNFKAVKSPY